MMPSSPRFPLHAAVWWRMVPNYCKRSVHLWTIINKTWKTKRLHRATYTRCAVREQQGAAEKAWGRELVRANGSWFTCLTLQMLGTEAWTYCEMVAVLFVLPSTPDLRHSSLPDARDRVCVHPSIHPSIYQSLVLVRVTVDPWDLSQKAGYTWYVSAS